MNRELIERTLTAMDKGYMGHHHAEYAAVMAALRQELEKPEPEPYGYVSVHRWLSGDVRHEFHFSLGTIYQNNCTSITPVYTKGTTNV